MGIISLLIIAIALSMDAFAVSICKGLSTTKVSIKHMIIAGLWFGGFQGLMPLIGYLLGNTFQQYINAFDHWIAFILLVLIGVNMVRESFSTQEETSCDSFGVKTMFVMAVATSIDALAIGVTFALLPDINIFAAVGCIGIVTFVVSCIGVKFGSVFGAKYESKAELFGGIILILMGLKILLEHLHILA